MNWRCCALGLNKSSPHLYLPTVAAMCSTLVPSHCGYILFHTCTFPLWLQCVLHLYLPTVAAMCSTLVPSNCGCNVFYTSPSPQENCSCSYKAPNNSFQEILSSEFQCVLLHLQMANVVVALSSLQEKQSPQLMTRQRRGKQTEAVNSAQSISSPVNHHTSPIIAQLPRVGSNLPNYRPGMV